MTGILRREKQETFEGGGRRETRKWRNTGIIGIKQGGGGGGGGGCGGGGGGGGGVGRRGVENSLGKRTRAVFTLPCWSVGGGGRADEGRRLKRPGIKTGIWELQRRREK